jgi:YidC/Oxa1 family membrane protein insertase
MERNALLAVVISLLILVLWNELVINRYMPQGEPGGEVATSAPSAPRADDAPAPPRAADAPAPPAAPDAPVAAESDSAAAAIPAGGDDVIVDTDLFRAVFTTAGARLVSLRLKKYNETPNEGSPQLELVHGGRGVPLPLGVYLRGKEEAADDTGVLYTVDRERLELSGGDAGEVVFTGQVAGASVRKIFEMTGDRYLWSMRVEVVDPPEFVSEIAVTWDSAVGDSGGWRAGVAPTANPYTGVLALEADKLQSMTRDDLIGGVPFNGATDWIGFSGQYFFSGLVSSVGGEESAARAWAVSTGDHTQAMLRLGGHPEGAAVVLYTGPKDLDQLDASGHSLRRALDLGWFTVVALPLLQLLRFTYRFTGNHGVDIVLLTVLIKVLFYPLTKKSFQSMKAMQKLQPEMERVRESYKDKPDQMNQAVMELYRKHKVNPLGGCLPMFLQLPVFIGLYNALLNAVELRHAPFVGWIQDLSAPDRLGDFQLPFVTGAGVPILTLIMGASMLVQQKMTPTTTADPMQQRMMMLMPVVFTFMFINFPAGLTLYWLVNNLLTIGQQYIINRQED